MKTVENLDEVVEILRSELIKQSELKPERVLNALSLTSTELDKLLEDDDDDNIVEEDDDEYEDLDVQEEVWDSITQDDTTLLFELQPAFSTSAVSMEEGDFYNAKEVVCSSLTICSPNTVVGDVAIDNSITYYKIYRLKLTLYGSNSSSVALKLVGRLRSSKVRTDLYSSGIYIEKVSEPDIINEFKNNLVWLRNDVQVDIGVKYALSQVDVATEYEAINTIKIYRRK